MSDVVNQGVPVIIPAALSTLIQVNLQDMRIGKIVGGIGWTLSGARLVAASGIPKNLKSWYWDDNRDKSSNPKTLQWGTAAAGLLITSYGIYNIATGILELTDLNDIKVCKPGDSKFSNKNNLNTCDIKLLKAKEQFLSCPEARNLWNEVERNGKFSIRCATNSETAGQGALCNIGRREILLSETDNSYVGSLLIELNNLKGGKEAHSISTNRCYTGIEAYAIGMEKFEYETVQNTYRVSNSCVKGGFWPRDLKQYSNVFNGKFIWRSLEDYLETQESNGHTDVYRKWWYEKCNPEGLSKWVASNAEKRRAENHILMDVLNWVAGKIFEVLDWAGQIKH